MIFTYRTKNIKDFLDLSGLNRKRFVLRSKLLQSKFTEDKVEVFLIYFDLMKNTTIFKPVVYDFYMNNMSYKQITQKYGLNKTQISNEINANTRTFFKEVGCDVYLDLRDSNDEQELNFYGKYLKELTVKYAKLPSKEQEQLIVNLSEYFPPVVENKPTITESELNQIIERLSAISIPYLKRILGVINPEYLGYIRYLLETPDTELNNQDLQIKEIIKTRLFLK